MHDSATCIYNLIIIITCNVCEGHLATRHLVDCQPLFGGSKCFVLIYIHV